MGNTAFEQRKRANAFFRSFNCNPMILFVGRHISDEELKLVADCPWSCVMTSRTDAAFSTYFKKAERSVQEYTTRAEIPARPLNREKLPILRLCGVEGHTQDEAANDDAFLQSIGLSDGGADTAAANHAQELLQLLPSLLDCVSQMVVTGYRPETEGELSLAVFARALLAVPDGNVQFWDVDLEQPSGGQLQQIADRKGFALSPDKLADIIRERTEDVEPVTPSESGDLYYVNNGPVSIRPEELMHYSYLATLLTDRTVYKIRPYGKLQYEKWFSNFLELSASNGPQWYGYLPHSTFYIKRSYEDTIVQLTRKMLAGGGMFDSQESGPIVLTGHPSSSKSITLGALAYRIYNEKLCPVIFIQNDTLLFYNGSQELDDLDNLMQYIEQQDGMGATRILLVWDCSSYRSGVSNAQNLVRQLNNRGRRFVLVCSAYSKPEDNAPGTEFYRMEKTGESTRFVTCDQEHAQVIRSRQSYYVPTTRTLTEREVADLRNKFKEYSGIDPATLRSWFDRLGREGEPDIFNYFYKLIALLRPQLEEGLSREQRKVAQYVNERFDKILGGEKKKQELSPMMQAFLKAGFTPEEIPAEVTGAEKEGSDTEFNEALDRMNLCVAMFSRFKLDMPSGLAFSILLDESSRGSVYSTENRALFHEVTNIPWLYYGESETGGDFVFRFRNALEAKIFLDNKGYGGREQVELLCDIMDLYGQDYRRSQCIDEELTKSLQDLLRLMGPNSRYLPFQQRKEGHGDILSNLDRLIEKVEDIRDVYGVPDVDMGFASIIVTFTREFYGGLWDEACKDRISAGQKPWEYDSERYSVECYEYRLKRLYEALTLANRCVDELDGTIRSRDDWYSKQHLAEQRDMLMVEIAQCNSLVERMGEEYRACCQACDAKPEQIQYSGCHMQYPEIFRQLVRVINRQPTNGYAYNVLFKAFLRAYDKESRSEKRLQYLSEIMQIVDICSNTEVLNRGANGRDEINENITAIQALSNDFRISIDEIKNRSAGEQSTYYDLYDKLLEANNPAAITFICQKELDRAKIAFRMNSQLSDYQVMMCEKIRKFMRSSENFQCITTNAYALAMLIRVSWMSYNERSLQGSAECQLTKLSQSQWEDLHGLCRQYFDRAEAAGRQPILVLLYALSTLQTSWNYNAAIQILNTLDEGQFYASARMRTPFMICDETGKPLKYSGTVLSTKDYSGYIRVNNVPEHLGSKTGIRFHRANLGRTTRMPERNSVLTDLELGIGYMGLSVYTDSGRQERGAQ